MQRQYTSPESALGYYLDQTAVVYLETAGNPDRRKPRWVEFQATPSAVGTICDTTGIFARRPLISSVLLTAALTWGPSKDLGYGVPVQPENAGLVVEPFGNSRVIRASGTVDDLLVESISLTFDTFLVDTANGRRFFGNCMSDEDLEHLVNIDKQHWANLSSGLAAEPA